MNRTVIKRPKCYIDLYRSFGPFLGPYGEMLESMMNSSKDMESKEKKELIFLKELLNSTQKQRLKLDLNSLETIGTKEETNIVEDVNTIETTEQQKSITDTIGRHLV